MKRLVCLIFFAVTIDYIHAQTDWPKHEWKAALTIVDDNGKPVPEAQVSILYDVPPPPGQKLAAGKITGLTDTNGIFVASHKDRTYGLGFRIEKAGYYKTWINHGFGITYDPVKWNPTVTLVLRKIGQPISMYAKKEEAKIQKENEPVGFDLAVGDWVSPLGAGKSVDLFFTLHRKIINAHEYDAELKLTFPNKGDGIIVAPGEPDTGSDFKTSRVAAESGYQSERIWHYSNTSWPQAVFGYFIRVRTQLDGNGKVTSAVYGKINGDFRFYPGTKAPRAGMGFDYYLNPNPNDRNVEFDPHQNLIKGLTSLEEIKAP